MDDVVGYMVGDETLCTGCAEERLHPFMEERGIASVAGMGPNDMETVGVIPLTQEDFAGDEDISCEECGDEIFVPSDDEYPEEDGVEEEDSELGDLEGTGDPE